MSATKFRCIVADPPWQFGDSLPGPGRGARKHYRTLCVDEMCALQPYRALAMEAPDAVLFLWRVSSMPEEPLRLARSWGFTVKAEIVWEKTTRRLELQHVRALQALLARARTERERRALRRGIELLSEPRTDHFGMGHYVRHAHETCLVCVRGKPQILNHSTRSRFRAPVGAHSDKPEAFYKLVEKLVPGPRLELFARRHRRGWTCLGDELGVAA